MALMMTGTRRWPPLARIAFALGEDLWRETRAWWLFIVRLEALYEHTRRLR